MQGEFIVGTVPLVKGITTKLRENIYVAAKSNHCC